MTNEAMAQRVADQFAKQAAKDPRVVAINRRMRKIKSEAVKYMNRAISDRHWDAGDTYDYIGLGTQFSLFGYVAPGEYQGNVRIELNFVPGREHNGDEAGSVNVSYSSHAPARGHLDGGRSKGIQTEDLAKSMAKILAPAAKTMAAHLKGDTSREKDRMLGKVEEALKTLPEVKSALTDLQKIIKSSKNLGLDASEIASAARKVQVHNIESAARQIRELAEAMGR